MPIINNYSFSDAVYSIPENASIPGEIGTATITISPLSGYTATAGDFSLDPSFSNEYVDSVTFTQSGSNVICTIIFLTGAIMPSANVTIPLCVIGSAEILPIPISGTITAFVGTNTNGNSSETNTPYSNDGAYDSNELLFSRTYNADSGYYFSSTPSCNITVGNQSNYNIVQTPTYNINGQLTNITFNVNYTYPSYSVSGDEVLLRVPSAVEIYQPLPLISGYVFNTSTIGNPEETRTLTVFGNPGTSFSATLNDGATTTTIINNETLDSSGRYNYNVTFPELIKGDPNVVYTIELTGSYVSTIEQLNPFIVNQLNQVFIKVDITNPPTPVSGWPGAEPRVTYKALSSTPFSNLNNSSGAWLLEINEEITKSHIAGGTFAVNKQVELTDFAEATVITRIVNSPAVSTTTLVLDDTTDILAGDKFNYIPWDPSHNGLLAPFTYEVVSVDTATDITITPAITIPDGYGLTFSRANGNVIEIIDSDVTLIDPLTVNLKFTVAVINYGDTDITYDINLSNIISYTPEP